MACDLRTTQAVPLYLVGLYRPPAGKSFHIGRPGEKPANVPGLPAGSTFFQLESNGDLTVEYFDARTQLFVRDETGTAREPQPAAVALLKAAYQSVR